MQSVYGQIRELGAELVAVSPQLVKYSKAVSEKNNLEFDILSDEGNKVAEDFGLTFGFPDYLIEIYRGFGADFERFNGDDSWTLPMPARYVVGKDGIIQFADFHPDYTVRPEPEKTLADLRKLS